MVSYSLLDGRSFVHIFVTAVVTLLSGEQETTETSAHGRTG